MAAKHFSYKVISILGSMLFCLILAFSMAKAETCTITSMPADNELYGTSQEIGVTMATATTAMREISVVLKWTDKEGNVQTEWLGDGKVATGSLTATATISTMASATISMAKVPDGKYEVFCMKKFDLMPDAVVEKPCDQQDMIVMYRGELLPTNTTGLEVKPCTDTIGVNSTFTKYFGFTGGYPEKRDADGECICAKYIVNEEKQDEKGQTIKGEDGLPIIVEKTYKDCSTAYVRFMIKDGAGGEVPDETKNPFPNPPMPAFIEDDMQNDAQVINFHVPSSGNCKVFEKSECPEKTKLIINSLYDEENENSPAVFKAVLFPMLNDKYKYKDNSVIVYKWSVYDLENERLIEFLPKSYSSDTMTIPDGIIDKYRAYRIEVMAYFKRNGCGDDNNEYITSISNYFDFSYYCHKVELLSMNETKVSKVPSGKKKACFRLPKDEIHRSYTVHLNGGKKKDNDVNNLDMYYFEGAFAHNDNGKLTRKRAEAGSSSIDSETAIDNSYEVFAGSVTIYTSSVEDMYVTVERKSNIKTATLTFSIVPRANFAKSIKVITSNVGVDYPKGYKLCDKIGLKICTTQMMYEYKDFIREKDPDIVNIQEMISTWRCDQEEKKGNINCDLPLSATEPYSVCCDMKKFSGISTAADIIFNLDDGTMIDKYDINCGPDPKNYDCIIYKKERFEEIEGSYISYYPKVSVSGACSLGGNSVSSILLKEKKTGRVFAIGNAHPEIGGIPEDGDKIFPFLGACGWVFETMSDIDCRALSIDALFQFTNIEQDGMPSNAIIAGDFNMDYNNLIEMRTIPNKFNCSDTKSIWNNTRDNGFKHIGEATVSFFGVFSLPIVRLDHAFSNLLNGTSNCTSYNTDPWKIRNVPSFGHNFIVCDISMDN